MNRMMDQLLSKEESYAERRKLFKNIWDTSMQVDEKDDIMNKPKIIKTLRLDEMDRCTAGKKKKQRIKNLRAVCNKLLDFCDRQDADDLFYEQMAAQGKTPLTRQIEPKIKKKHIKFRKGLKKTKSMLSSTNVTTTARTTTSEIQDCPKTGVKTSKIPSPTKNKRASIGLATKHSVNPKQSRRMTLKNGASEVTSTSQRRIIKKKRSKNKPERLDPGIHDDCL
ncbi:uncharacterized protein LOC125077838 [Vanessa atalanta]|uniref:uncharacterized protein LOC125077838 n=1 Tax=Vanessa atalanta TaxID=42275 RepID=UPI001FCCF7F5|nr:uncharacterized protein LOC125077838 [Vanessa atalanta]